MTLKEKLDKLPFKEEVQDVGGEIYAVGGAVRDELLKIKSKDLDLLIRCVNFEVLNKILQKYGRVDNVGESFGIIKFKGDDNEEIDIALPRTEKKIGKKHTDFKVDYNCNLPLAVDLQRRDFTINAMAMDINGNIIDPHNGQADIVNKQIKLVNKDAFSEDPLRMLRAIQFASRFKDFEIDTTTGILLCSNKALIKDISVERILIEFDKIIKKGDCLVAAKLLHKFQILTELIYSYYTFAQLIHSFDSNKIKTMAEFLFFLLGGEYITQSFVKTLKCDNDTIKEVKALYKIYYSNSYSVYFEAVDICPKVLDTEVFINSKFNDYRKSSLPKNLSDIVINGYVLMELGIQGKEIGKVFKEIVRNILVSNILNTEEDIVKFVKTKYNI